jgi:glycogen debranching enzyme
MTRTPSTLSRASAQATLRDNDRGGYTVPSDRLYPFQWNWDSGVVALGWMTFDEERAWKELEMLLQGQWESGMIPHIVFHKEADSYFPGPDQWGVDRKPPTSSISQPPLLATMVRLMQERATDTGLADAKVRAMLPQLVAYHRWWYRDRDPEGTGLVVSYHPWESGMDNSPAWDAPLSVVPPTTRAYQRRDTQLIDTSQRPHQSEYDRYLRLVDLFKELKFDARAIYKQSPYRVADFSLNAILQRATLDVVAMCDAHGHADWAAELRAHAERGRAALLACWNDELQQYNSRDTRTGEVLAQRTHGGFLAWYARLDDKAHFTALQENLEEWLDRSEYGIASTYPGSDKYEPKRYWRGPVWPHMNWLVAAGCEEAGLHALHNRIQTSTRKLLEKSGLYEYFNPQTGEGYGGDNFSWTAAVALFWLL